MAADPEAALCAALRGSPGGVTRAEDDLVACARAHRLHLLLATRLRRDDLAAELRDAAAVDAAREVELQRTIGALAAAGVRPICIKGAALAQTHYPRPETRPRLDTDLLIAPDTRDAAGRTLAALGYHRPVETDGDLCVSQVHWTRVDATGVEHQLDVHWRLSNVLAFAGVLSYAEVAATAVPLPRLGRDALGPSAPHSLVIACIHRVAHHRDSPHLLWLCDIARVADALDERGRRAFEQLVIRRQVRAVCAAGLRRAGDAFGGAASDLARRVAPPPGTPSEPTAALLARNVRLVDVLTSDLRALDSWTKRLQLVREHVFPSREYMVARYGAGRPLAWLYVQRIASGAPKWFRS
jgi:putative nucleotidyltransferase-like protein